MRIGVTQPGYHNLFIADKLLINNDNWELLLAKICMRFVLYLLSTGVMSASSIMLTLLRISLRGLLFVWGKIIFCVVWR